MEWGYCRGFDAREYVGFLLMMNRTTRSDWLAWETRRVPMETAIPAF